MREPVADANRLRVLRLGFGREEKNMSSRIDTVKGLSNISVGFLKRLAAEISGAKALHRVAACQQEKGRAQLVWAREERARENAFRGGDAMVRKLMRRDR